jgi:hypothetical protein
MRFESVFALEFELPHPQFAAHFTESIGIHHSERLWVCAHFEYQIHYPCSHCHFSSCSLLPKIFSASSMAASHPVMFKTSSIDEDDIHRLVTDHLLPPHAILQWRLTKGEEIPTSITNEIVVSKAFFQWGFSFPNCNFFRSLLQHFKIKFVHLNPYSIL